MRFCVFTRTVAINLPRRSRSNSVDRQRQSCWELLHVRWGRDLVGINAVKLCCFIIDASKSFNSWASGFPYLTYVVRNFFYHSFSLRLPTLSLINFHILCTVMHSYVQYASNSCYYAYLLNEIVDTSYLKQCS